MGCGPSSKARHGQKLRQERVEEEKELAPASAEQVLPRPHGQRRRCGGTALAEVAVEEKSKSASSSSAAPLGGRGQEDEAAHDEAEDDGEDLEVARELSGMAQSPATRIRALRKFSGRMQSNSFAVPLPDTMGAVQALRQQLSFGTMPISEASFENMLGRQNSRGFASGSLPVAPGFGFDCAAVIASTPHPSEDGGAASQEPCSICFSAPEEGKLLRLCRNPECKGRFCSACVGQYATTKVEEALHFVPVLRCPSCWCRISTSAWTAFVADSIHKRYLANAAALLTMRCASCDATYSLLQKEASAVGLEEMALGRLRLELDAGARAELRTAWLSFSIGESDADKLVAVLVDLATRGGLRDGVGPPDHLEPSAQAFFSELTALITDVERRVTLQLAVLRRFPKIKTGCCSQKMCFKCKVRGWHPRVSCEERQRRFLSMDAAGIQACPQCGVPTQKTEGCNEVQCVCGHSWSWVERAGAVPGGVPAVSVALALPERGPELVRTLFTARADIAATNQDGWGIFHFGAAQRQRLQRREGVGPVIAPHSDATRLQAALDLGPEALALIDVPGNDGETALSVAVAHDNVDGVRLLLSQGCKLHPEVIASLRAFASPRAAAEACEALRPHTARLAPAPGMLWLWIETGLIDRVREALAAGESVDVAAAESLVLLRAAHRAGACVAEAYTSVDEIEDMLQQAAGAAPTAWPALRRSGAKSVLRREVRLAYLEHRRLDVELIKALLEERADPDTTLDMSSEERGRSVVPLVSLIAAADPRFQAQADQDVMKLLLAAAASPNAENVSEDPPLWFAISRPNVETVRLLVANGATWPQHADAAARLAQVLQRVSDRAALYDIFEALGPVFAAGGFVGTPPLWLGLLLPHMQAAVLDRAEALAREGSTDEIAMAYALLSGRTGNDALPVLESLTMRVVSAGGEAVWQNVVEVGTTALLLREVRSVHVYDRELNMPFVETLLGLGAKVNATQRAFPLFKQEWGDEEDYTPLVLLANASGLPAATTVAAARLLIERRADVEHADGDGDTALAWAVMRQNVPMVQVLAAAGAALCQTLVSEDDSPLASGGNPDALRSVALALGPSMRTALEGFPSPPLWLAVQFGSPQVVRAALPEQDPPTVTFAEVEALLRRRLHGGCWSNGAIGGGSTEDLRVANCLRRAAMEQNGSPDEEAAARLWRSMVADASTSLLRQEIEGAFEGLFLLDVGFAQALLCSGADPNLQVVVGEDEDEDDDEDDAEEWEEAEEEDSDVDTEDDDGDQEVPEDDDAEDGGRVRA